VRRFGLMELGVEPQASDGDFCGRFVTIFYFVVVELPHIMFVCMDYLDTCTVMLEFALL